MTNYLNKASQFTEAVIKIAKSNGHHDFVEQACNKESQARFLENIKSFGATDRSGTGNTPATGSGFLQVNSAPIQVYSQPSGIKDAIVSRGFSFAPNGNLISGTPGRGFEVEMPTLRFSGESRYKTFDQALDLDDSSVTRGLSTYKLIPRRYVVQLPFTTLQGISTNHSLSDMYNIYREQDKVDKQLLMDRILVDSLNPLIGNTSIVNTSLSTQASFPLISSIFDMEASLYSEGAQTVALLVNYKQAKRIADELLSSGVRIDNFSGSTLGGRKFNLTNSNSPYYGNIGAVEVFRTNLIKDQYVSSAGAIDANTGGNKSAMFAFDPSAVANNKGSEEYEKFVVETETNMVRAITNGGCQLAAICHAGGVVVEPTRATYVTF